VWSSFDDLVDKIRYYLANPAEAFRIRRAGQKKLLEFHSPEVKIQEFWDLVFHGKENPAYLLERERSAVPKVFAKPAMEMLPAYEFFQELHRNRSRLVFYCAGADMDFIQRFVDLPRVECKPHEEWAEVEKTDDVEFPEERILHLAEDFDAQALESIFMKSEPRLVFAPEGNALSLSDWGYTQNEVGVFECTRPIRGIVRRARALDLEAARPLLEECLDFFSGFRINSIFDRQNLLYFVAPNFFNFGATIQKSSVYSTFGQFSQQNVSDLADLKIIVGEQGNFFLFELNPGRRPFKVKTIADFF
jgi:hypothetical protein